MLINQKEYFSVLANIKEQISKAQYRAILGVNKEQILLYYNIGKIINENNDYGSNFVDNLARDIKSEFPDCKGYSARNLRYMRKFSDMFNADEILQVPLAELTWYHLQTLMDRVKDKKIYIWYVVKTLENGWSRNVLLHQIESNLYNRQAIAQKTTNFEKSLEAKQSKLAIESLKNPYVFDFISIREDIIEKEIESELVGSIAKTLLELGSGFAFVGNQYHLSVGGADYYIDLLFYNTNLRCYIVIELKTGKFKPEYAGKLNFYLSAVDDMLKHKSDNPSIGIILCKESDRLTAEYALKDMSKPIGVSEYRLSDFVPKEFINDLPSAQDIEKRIRDKYDIN